MTLLHTGFVEGVNSTGDIPYTEMPVDLQSDLYGMGKVHDLHVECYIIVYFLYWYMSVKYSGQFPLTDL